MLFNSYIFIFIFLPLCLCGFYRFYKTKNDNWVIWVNFCSIVFYSYWSVYYVSLFLLSITFNYWISEFVQRRNKFALVSAIVFNLGLLGYFKYAGFFIAQMDSIFGFGLVWPEIILPIGISFFTFVQIAYHVDLYQDGGGKVSFSRYFFFVSFFPHLIAGPILHHKEIFSQFGQPRNHIQAIAIGLSVFALGLFKKVVIADTLSGGANGIFSYAELGGSPTFIEAWYGTLCYMLQIYFDFSAYSDMASGLSFMFGFRFPQNFSSPYKSRSIIEFWQRWHMTLSHFLRDYLYIPLGGNRKGAFRRYFNLMLTMLIGGFWHGASWSFILWGGLHGMFLVINHFYRASVKFRMSQIFAWPLTFFCIAFSWVPFRSVNMTGTLEIWKGMFFFNGIKRPNSLLETGPKVGQILSGDTLYAEVFLILALACSLFAPNVYQIFGRHSVVLKYKDYDKPLKINSYLLWRPDFFWGLFITGILIISIFKLNDPSDFLYFQF